ncbi:MAG: DUF6279 family lipoprotein [Burkholderiaceae bacterium]
MSATRVGQNSSISRLASVPVLALLLVVLGACSLMRTGYNWLPTAANWRLATYLTPTAEQQTKIDEHLDSLLEWHRSVELPRYAAFLQRVLAHPGFAGAPGGVAVTAADVRAWREEVVQVWPPLAERLSGPVFDVAVTLSAEQFAGIRAGIRQRRDQLVAEHGGDDPDRRLAHRIERWESRLERLFGELSDKQRALIAHRVRQMPANEAWWQTRFEWQQGFVDELERLVTQRVAPAEAVPRVHAWLASWLQPGDETVRRLAQESAEHADRLLAELFALASAEQWRHARGFVSGLAEDFSVLSQQ